MKYHVPGVDVPDTVEKKMKTAVDPKQEGYRFALETIRELQKMKGVSGIHITALFWEDVIPSLVREAGLLPRP